MVSESGKWSNATLKGVKECCIPNKYNINNYRYQFLNLLKLVGVLVEVTKKYLSNKGNLSKREEVLIWEPKEYNLNGVYLVAHSLLDTANGISELVQDIIYKGVVVYNMYGIKVI